jgi:hypothetical protein
MSLNIKHSDEIKDLSLYALENLLWKKNQKEKSYFKIKDLW